MLKNSPKDFRPAHKGYPGRTRLHFKVLKLTPEEEERLLKWSRKRSKDNPLFRGLQATSPLATENPFSGLLKSPSDQHKSHSSPADT